MKRKTRNQIRRERIKAAVLMVVMIVLFCACCVLTVKALDHPAENPVNGNEYMEQIAKYSREQPKQEPVVQPVAEQTEENLFRPYEVPLDTDLQEHIALTCEEYRVDPYIVFAVIWQESGFNAAAVGDSGNSFGLMQIQPRWHSGRMERLDCEDLLDPFQNVTVGIDYLAEQIERYDGDEASALVAYNQGHFNGTVTDYALSVLEKADELRGDSNA